MQFSMLSTQSVTVIGKPIDANGDPSPAILSGAQYSSSDPSVFAVNADPSTPNGAVIVGVGAGTATLLETALATEPDGTSQNIQGVATIIITAVAPPPPPAASLEFSFGTPS